MKYLCIIEDEHLPFLKELWLHLQREIAQKLHVCGGISVHGPTAFQVYIT